MYLSIDVRIQRKVNVCRIGALQVGDRIVAINGKPLKDRTVSFAIQQLQHGADVICLTISRDKSKDHFINNST